MRKKYSLLFGAAAAVVGLLLPAAASAAGECGGLLVCFAMFLLIDPLFFLSAGIFAGFDLRQRWYMPLPAVVLFWVGTGLFLTWSTDILFYAAVYTAISGGAMLATHFIRRLRRKA